MPFRPAFPGERPTLGFEAIAWMGAMLAAPDRLEYEPYVPTTEQAEFLLRYYELDPHTGKRVVRRGVLSRPRGWGKSPFVAAMAMFEALGDCVGDGFDADGRPVGKPWVTVRTPIVQIAAVSEDQTANTWSPLLEMCEGPVYDEYVGLEPLSTFVNLPKGVIRPVTASASTIKGARPVFSVADQTETWLPSNGGVKMAETMRINATKVGGSFIETPNAYTPGDGSVAERTALAWKAIQEGRARIDRGLFVDHREAPPETILTDRASLEHGLRVAYGCSSNMPCVLHEKCGPGWADIDDRISDIWMPDADPQRSRADYLNQITFASNSWIAEPEWAAIRAEGRVVEPGEPVTLGFDGSRGRSRGKPDASALVGCCVRDGHLFEIGVWEADDDPASWESWEAPVTLIDAAVRDTFARYNVVGFYADPGANWRSYVNQWEAAFSQKVRVKATANHPFEWWMTGGRSGLVQKAIEDLEGAIRNRDCTHDGAYALTRHVLNTRRRFSRDKLALGKESDYSPKKIDAAVAAVLAYTCRLDAVSKGLAHAGAGVGFTRIR